MEDFGKPAIQFRMLVKTELLYTRFQNFKQMKNDQAALKMQEPATAFYAGKSGRLGKLHGVRGNGPASKSDGRQQGNKHQYWCSNCNSTEYLETVTNQDMIVMPVEMVMIPNSLSYEQPG